MNNVRNNLILLCDNSASVGKYSELFVAAINSIMNIQEKYDPRSHLSLVTFNTKTTLVHVNQFVKDTPRLESKEYNTTGRTALYDSVGYSLPYLQKFYKKMETKQKNTVIVLSDGEDNASRRFSPAGKVSVRNVLMMLGPGWRCIFLSTTQKAVEIGLKMGFHFSILYDVTENSLERVMMVLHDILHSGKLIVRTKVCDLTDALNGLTLRAGPSKPALRGPNDGLSIDEEDEI